MEVGFGDSTRTDGGRETATQLARQLVEADFKEGSQEERQD